MLFRHWTLWIRFALSSSPLELVAAVNACSLFNFNFCRFGESVCLFIRWLGSVDTRVRVYDLFIFVSLGTCAHVWCAPLFVSFKWIRVHALGMSLLYWHLCMLFSFIFLFVHATRCNHIHETSHFMITHFIGWDVGIRRSWAHQFIIGCQPLCPFSTLFQKIM